MTIFMSALLFIGLWVGGIQFITMLFIRKREKELQQQNHQNEKAKLESIVD